MMKSAFFSGLVIALLMFSDINLQAQGLDLKKRSLGEGVTMLVPTAMHEVGMEEMRERYRTISPPMSFFATENNRTNLVVNLTPVSWDNIDLLHKFYEANIGNTFSKVDFMQNEVIEINGRKFVAFEFISHVEGEPNSAVPRRMARYHKIYYTLLYQQVLVFNFYCPTREHRTWKPVAAKMMESINIKE